MRAAVSRRAFLGRSAAAAAGTLATATTLQTLTARAAGATKTFNKPKGDGYGNLQRMAASNTGEELLALPEGFQYLVVSQSGRMMSDGTPTPIALDGMAAFKGREGHVVRLVRNHEVRTGPNSPIGRVLGPVESAYDPSGVGGNTTLDFDTNRGELIQDFVSLHGTIVNCAGGMMLHDAGWLTCEEATAGVSNGWTKPHGYVFEVPLMGPLPGSPATSVPIPAMGRFSHEAVAVDPHSGFVYETEDQSNTANGFFRYRPNDRRNLAAGGTLEMLRVVASPGYDTREGQAVGAEIEVDWVVIADPDPDLEGGAPPCRQQGFDQGAAMFNRLEGCWYGAGSIFFNSTSGGDVNSDGYAEGYGQVWRYIPDKHGDRGRLVLVYESTGSALLDSPDNLLFTPRGGILLCEDDAGSIDGDMHPLAPGTSDVNRLIGLDRDGLPFEFAVNITDDSEFAGACFSPDGQVMFVNTFGNSTATDPPGRTYAVTGPWSQGPL